MKRMIAKKLYSLLSAFLYLVFMFACFFVYLIADGHYILMLTMIGSSTLWFYSFAIELGYLFGFLEE